jgi:hypothetical protein
MMTTSDSSPGTLLMDATCETESGTVLFADDTSFAMNSVGATCSGRDSVGPVHGAEFSSGVLTSSISYESPGSPRL